MIVSGLRKALHICQALSPLPAAHHFTDFVPPNGRHTQLFEKVPCFVPRDAPLPARCDQGAKQSEIHYQGGRVILSCEIRHCFETGVPIHWSAVLNRNGQMESMLAQREDQALLFRLWRSGCLVLDRRLPSINGAEGVIRKSKAIRLFLHEVERVRRAALSGSVGHFKRFYGRIFGLAHVKRQLGTKAAHRILSTPYFS